MKRKTLDLAQTLALVEPLALRHHRDGETRLSALALIEEARSSTHEPLNNSHAPKIARQLVARHPQLRDCFELRALGRGGKHGARSYSAADLKRSFALGVAWARANPEVKQ